jgi:pyruvate formate lyase activating enzyme
MGQTASLAPPAPLTEVTGRIFDVQTFSIHDGPGIRTTVFLKGCPLRCLWCHNPESIESRRDVGFFPAKSLLCGQCVAACEHGGHEILDGVHAYDRRRCVRCGACIPGCPTGALEVAGKDVTAGWIVEQVEKDRMFYERSGGGMTLSGGEPLLQPGFSLAILSLAKERGLHTALDTCGHYPWAMAEPIFRAVDLVLYDLKAVDSALHESLTGVPNDLILGNLDLLLAMNDGPTVWLRLPLIPGCNDSEDAIAKMIEFCAGIWGNPRLQGATIMPYHRLAESKYERFGREYTLTGLMPPSDEHMEEIMARFNERGVPLKRE